MRKAGPGWAEKEQEGESPGTEEGEVSHQGPRRFPGPPGRRAGGFLRELDFQAAGLFLEVSLMALL